jgi:hypothetical protein
MLRQVTCFVLRRTTRLDSTVLPTGDLQQQQLSIRPEAGLYRQQRRAKQR